MPLKRSPDLSRQRLRGVALGLLLVTPGKAQDRELCGQSYQKAQEFHQARKLREARRQLTECLRSCAGAFAADCLLWAREVDGALPTVVFRARRAGGGELDPVTVALDGGELTSRLDGKALDLDPGPHTFEFRFQEERVTRTETIREGEKNRLIEVEFPSLPASNLGAPPPLATLNAPAAPASAMPSPLPASPPRSPWIWPLVAVGGATLVGAGVLGYTTMARAEELRGRCAPVCPGEDVDALRVRRNAADVLLGVGLLSLGGAAYLAWFREPAIVSVGPRWVGVRGEF